jgi:hypothetical protein
MEETMIARPIKWVLAPEGQPIFSEEAYNVEIVDDAGGEFVSVSSNLEGNGKIDIDISDWESLKAMIESAIKEVRK